MKERILKTLNDFLLCNRDVLSKAEIEDIEEQIKAVEDYKPRFRSLFKTKHTK